MRQEYRTHLCRADPVCGNPIVIQTGSPFKGLSTAGTVISCLLMMLTLHSGLKSLKTDIDIYRVSRIIQTFK